MDTKHKSDCQMSFGRKDPSCPRCQELLAGAAPRAGWQTAHFELKRRQEEARAREPKHDCVKSNCSTVCCTFGDW